MEDEGFSAPLLIAAEGFVTNNKYILPFKRGSFSALRSIVPISLQYEVNETHVHPMLNGITTM